MENKEENKDKTCTYGGDGVHTFELPNIPSPEGTTLKYMICVNGIWPVSED